ncbi:hypothetical protein OYE22_20105 [Streptomyces sp. 71268]|uniref:hypothetical protein n=1 Tax=Streptomyces sp. 71268 TaxID=3002640 RepID=UPI0023F822FD|nr:hypothetical protein [Streptomyces sp. 71268]WEV27247.1 hypothetical protein OYE22_20105 [Streptomyces sp. 71268]
MPSYDSSRARFRLADRHMAVFAHLVDGETPVEELWDSLTELQGIGLVGEEGELAPALAPLLTAMANPTVLITAEVTGEHGTLNHGIIVGQDDVFVHDGWPGEEESEYVPIDGTTIVWELARMVNLMRGDAEDFKVASVETTMGALDAAFSALEEAEGDEAKAGELTREALTRVGGLPAVESEALSELILSMNSMWRITSVWDGEHEGERSAMVRALAVWDCGPRGYWVREKPEEPILEGQVGPDSALKLVRVSPGRVWERITDLLPDKHELAAAP